MLYLRSFIFNIVCYSTLTVGCIFNSLVGLVSPKATIKIWNYTFIPFLVWSLKHLAGIEIEIRGRQYMMQEDCIYAGKHESALETYVLSNYIKRASFVLKKELTYIPIFGWAQYFYGMIPVDRSAGSAAMKNMLRSAKDRLQDDRPLIIFPKEPDANRDRNHVINPVSPSCIKISTYRLFLSPSTPAFSGKKALLCAIPAK